MESIFNISPPTALTVVALRQASLNDAQILGGHYIKSLVVDNPSGCWLIISADNTFVPPYTLGFAHNLDYSAMSISVSFVDTGPAGQLSTLLTTGGALNKVRIIIADHEVSSSGGSTDYTQFVNRQQQPEINSTPNLTLDLSTGATVSVDTNLLGGSLINRLRVYDVFCDNLNVTEALRIKQYWAVLISEVTKPGNVVRTVLANDSIHANKQSLYTTLEPGGYIDLLLGSEIRIQATSAAADAGKSLSVGINYAII